LLWACGLLQSTAAGAAGVEWPTPLRGAARPTPAQPCRNAISRTARRGPGGGGGGGRAAQNGGGEAHPASLLIWCSGGSTALSSLLRPSPLCLGKCLFWRDLLASPPGGPIHCSQSPSTYRLTDRQPIISSLRPTYLRAYVAYKQQRDPRLASEQQPSYLSSSTDCALQQFGA
jgi:hypothetical protein